MMPAEYTAVSLEYDRAIERAMQERKTAFCRGYLALKESELGTKKMNREREKLWNHAAKCWDLAQAGRRRFYELEEESGRRIMEWKDLEKPLRQWLENEAVGEGWTEDMVERTVEARHRDFLHEQKRVKGRMNRIRDPNADFRKRVLNPETREAAIRKYVRNHVNWKHYIAEALNILFEELEKRR